MSGGPLVPKRPHSSLADASLDEYCERLNSAFEQLGKRGGASLQPTPAPAPAYGSESLESYLDRLTDAFDKLSRQRSEPVDVSHETSLAAAVTVVEAEPEPPIDEPPIDEAPIDEAPPAIEVTEPPPATEVVPQETTVETPIATPRRPRSRPLARKKTVRAIKQVGRSRKKIVSAPRARKRALSGPRKRRGGK